MIELFPHQAECLKKTEDRNRVAYYLDMGLGKTFVGSEKMKSLGSNVNLIVCQKSKVQDWVDHFKMHYECNDKGYCGYTYNLTNETSMRCFFEEVIILKENTLDGLFPIYGIINYELVWRRPELLNLENFTLMLDESSLIQNTESKRSSFILKMKPSNVILLSGTPTGGKYENLWSQLHLLGWDISEKVYDTHYVNYKKIDVGGHIHKTVDKAEPYKNVERLKAKMREHGAVFMKTEEVMTLPDQMFQIITVPSTKEYNLFTKNKLVEVELDGKVREFVGDSLFAIRSAQRQLCGAYNQNKLDAFRDLCQSTNDRLVVFYTFNSELEALKKILIELDKPISIINGEVKDRCSFDNNSDGVMLIQYMAGSMGLNLQNANKIIYFSLCEESENFEQSKKRIHRIGQKKTCFYYILISKGTIEEQEILPTLNIRKEYTDELFKEQKTEDCPPWND